jgi:hypothetical protein
LAERLQKVQTLALTEWLEWAAARQRHNSLSELDATRILNLFLTVRHAPPTVEALVEQLAIPQGRATSMVGRMKYGKARELIKLSFVEAAREVEQRLKSEEEDKNPHARPAARVARVPADVASGDASTRVSVARQCLDESCGTSMH